MKRSLLSFVVCPACAGPLEIRQEMADSAEIVDGKLDCLRCRSEYLIVKGVPRFLDQALPADQKATADAFSYEWNHYSKLTDADEREFLGWISPLKPQDFEDRVVLDAGCGKGRHIFLAARYGAKTVIGVDLSDAVEAAYQNTKHLPNVHVIQADILKLPFLNSFDLVYSIGVLHHMPVPKDGFMALSSHLKRGGRISAWVYGKEGNLWIEKLVDPIRKSITSRLPRPVTRCLSFIPAVVLYVLLQILYRPAKRRAWLKHSLPYSDYLCSISGYSFAENFWNVFDQLVAPTAFYHSQEEIVDWFRSVQAAEVAISRHNSNSWRGTGVIGTSMTAIREIGH